MGWDVLDRRGSLDIGKDDGSISVQSAGMDRRVDARRRRSSFGDHRFEDAALLLPLLLPPVILASALRSNSLADGTAKPPFPPCQTPKVASFLARSIGPALAR